MPCRSNIPLIFILVACINILWTPHAFAQGIIIEPGGLTSWEPPPRQGYTAQPVTLENHAIQIDLDDQFAHVRTSQTFRNNTWSDLEGTWVFPVPIGADISDFSLWMDGHELVAETLGAGQASQIYRDIVNTMRDPGLLEYQDAGLIQAHIYPIPANGTKQIDMEYDWLIPIDSDLMKIELPLRLEGYSIDVINQLAITIDIQSPDSLGTIYSPTHSITLSRQGSRRAMVSFEQSAHRPQGDFVLYISRPGGPVGVNLLTHATRNDEGYFLAMIAPEYEESNLEIIPKDFVCVLDTSGSMAGEKMEQSKEALDYIFRNLNPEDRFQLITFATDVYAYFRGGWTDASQGNVSDVREYIDGLGAGGSTYIQGALDYALSSEPARNRPMYIIFLTDGLPTVGETNTGAIIQSVNAANSHTGARFFCFGVGDDVDYEFIDRLSRENGGHTVSVGPDDNLEQPLSELYSKIKSPMMTGLEVEITGTRIYDLLPVDLPDLFLGSQLILAGRYVGSGSGNLTLTGYVGTERVRYTYPVRFRVDRDNDFIPRHWATRRVGYLLNEINLYGENQELVNEIIDHATRYGIITPYTSMLVTEDVPMTNIRPWQESPESGSGGGNWLTDLFSGGLGMSGGGSSPAVPYEQYDYRSQSLSSELSDMETYGREVPRYDMTDPVRQQVRYAGDKTFYLNPEGYWVDSEYVKANYEVIYIEYMSDDYFDLVDEDQQLAEYLGLGSRMIVVWRGNAYEIGPDEGAIPSGGREPRDPDDDDDPDRDKKPVSGDENDANYLGVLLIIALIGIVVLAFIKGRKPE